MSHTAKGTNVLRAWPKHLSILRDSPTQRDDSSNLVIVPIRTMAIAKTAELKPGSRRHCRSTKLRFVPILLVLLVSVFGTAAYNSEVHVTFKAVFGYPLENATNVHVGSRGDWENGNDLPEFCKALLAAPIPLNGSKRDMETMKCDECTPYRMFSQYHQDYFFYSQHFQHLKRPGIYLDIAANEPIDISNTYFHDRCLGWKGVCLEGNPEYFEKLYRMRSCHLVPTCVGSVNGETVQFGLHHEIGGIVGDTFKNFDRLKYKGWQLTTMTERCTTMEHVLERKGLTVIDFVSLDVEGHELEVLKGFDLDKVIINVMSIEVRADTVMEIDDYLTSKGYVRYLLPQFGQMTKENALLGEDAVFLHSSVEFGKPR
ncbi:S-adenosyl-L-methionine-dependent methyltransferase [Gracilaria domingensis]|nr:S-adenosyl-L-methionine-dependent methyltransferase [Gracilaria domingensis]